MPVTVEGKVAFVTGGGSGVGLGMAKAFAAAGMKVVVADIRQDHLDEAMTQFDGAAVHPVRLDVTDRAAMAAAADDTERVFGKVHVVCNNAGINLFNDIGSATYQDWDWVFGVNLGGVGQRRGHVRPADQGARRGRARRRHRVDGVVRRRARRRDLHGGEVRVRGISEALRWSVLPHRIGVSVVCPGLVESQIYESDKIRPPELSTDVTPADADFMARLPEIHKAGMSGDEVGEKTLQAIRENRFYVFTHPEFREELREIFDEALAALPDESRARRPGRVRGVPPLDEGPGARRLADRPLGSCARPGTGARRRPRSRRRRRP